MTKPPRNWQKQALIDSLSLEDMIDELTGIRANIDQARREDDFEAYYEALMEWGVEASEP